MALSVSDLRLLGASRYPGGSKDEWNLCSGSSHRDKNCQAVFFVAMDFCLS
jgi:hypothetical protein